MNKKNNIFSVLDIGSSKINCIQSLTERNGITKIIGQGTIATTGVRAGIITDFEKASESIQKAITDCEKQSDQIIRNLSVSISSDKCYTKKVKSKSLIKDERVSQNDIEICINKVIDSVAFSDKKIIYISPVDYSIDNSKGISNPLNMFGDELEVDLLITYIGLNQFKNYIECITSCNVDVDKIVFSNYAAGLATLNENELDIGSVVIDIGARITTLGIFSNKSFIFSDAINFGGYDITEAIARKLSISFEEAEKLKVMHSSVLDNSKEEDTSIEIPSINYENKENYITVTKKDLFELVTPFYEEILKWVNNSINNSGFSNLIGRVIVFTGGASQIDGLSILANNLFNFNSRIGIAKNIKFNFHHILDASHSVSAGLIQNELNLINISINKNLITREKNEENRLSFSFLKKWLAENFF